MIFRFANQKNKQKNSLIYTGPCAVYGKVVGWLNVKCHIREAI